jgi:multimeric flavodoxin WrbA
MKVIAFNGSPRKDGNTGILIHHVLDELKKERIKTEYIHIGGKKISGCIACYQCFKKEDKQCAIKGDAVNSYIKKMMGADGIILGSPTYFTDITPEMKALIDRAGLVARANKDMFRRKIGAAVIAVRRGGATHAFDTINHFFLIEQMIIAGSTYWNMGIGLDKGDVEKDEEGIRTMKVLGQNMAWLLKKLHR